MQTSTLFIVERLIFNEPVSPLRPNERRKRLRHSSQFQYSWITVSALSPSYLHYPPPSFNLFLSANNRRTSKWWGKVSFSHVESSFDVARRQGRGNSHTTKNVPFCLQQPKMDSFFLLLYASSLRQERMESVWRADTMSQSEARVSVRERVGR